MKLRGHHLSLLRCIALLVCLAQRLTEVGAAFSADTCPREFKEYAAFHKATNGSPGAKYLVFSCATAGQCKGMGARPVMGRNALVCCSLK